MLFSQFCELRRFVFDQSSPVHPVSEFRGGPLSVTKYRRRTEILVSNIGQIYSSGYTQTNKYLIKSIQGTVSDTPKSAETVISEIPFRQIKCSVNKLANTTNLLSEHQYPYSLSCFQQLTVKLPMRKFFLVKSNVFSVFFSLILIVNFVTII